MPRLFLLMTFALLCLVGCSEVTVGQCGPVTTDFLSREEHRSMVMHPKGCYGSWGEKLSGFEAERRALLLCSETNPDSETQCKVVATDHSVCPIALQSWIEERDADTAREQRNCELGRPFVVRSEPGSEPPSVDDTASAALTKALNAFGVKDYDPGATHTIVFGRSPESKSNWIVTEALHFVPHKDTNRICLFRVASSWDPQFKHFETEFTVHLLGCFEKSGSGSAVSGQ